MTAADICALREKMNTTQRKFAGLFGVSPRTVAAWEAGTRPHPTSMKLLRQAQALFDTSHQRKSK